jgi:hypothetical protein
MISLKGRVKTYVELLNRLNTEGERVAVSKYRDLLSHAGIFNVINRWEKEGIIEIKKAKGDARKNTITLTGKGKQYLEFWRNSLDKMDLF